MRIDFGYGRGVQRVDIPDRNLLCMLESNPLKHERGGADAVEYALDDPIGLPRLEETVKPGQTVAIITSDVSRPVPSWEILPSIVSRLNRAGIPDRDISVVFALGSHRRQTDLERRQLVGDELYERLRCVDSDPDDCVRLGVTSQGTPVDITRSVAQADYRIAVGNIEFHYFAGYSGGVKALMPGVSTPQAIQQNHRMMVSPDACAGKLEGNPIRQDLEEAGRICGVDYIVNAVLDEHRHIIYAVAGDSVAAHREGCRYLDRMYRKHIPARADIVIVSQGGAPKDANLYQTQKALDNAKHAVRDGGLVILIGECGEGMGSAKFEQWFKEADTAHSLIERIGRDFQLGGHKAAAIAMVLEHAGIELVSAMSDELVESLFMVPSRSAQASLDRALERYGPEATVIAMPFGGATLPYTDD